MCWISQKPVHWLTGAPARSLNCLWADPGSMSGRLAFERPPLSFRLASLSSLFGPARLAKRDDSRTDRGIYTASSEGLLKKKEGGSMGGKRQTVMLLDRLHWSAELGFSLWLYSDAANINNTRTLPQCLRELEKSIWFDHAIGFVVKTKLAIVQSNPNPQ